MGVAKGKVFSSCRVWIHDIMAGKGKQTTTHATRTHTTTHNPTATPRKTSHNECSPISHRQQSQTLLVKRHVYNCRSSTRLTHTHICGIQYGRYRGSDSKTTSKSHAPYVQRDCTSMYDDAINTRNDDILAKSHAECGMNEPHW